MPLSVLARFRLGAGPSTAPTAGALRAARGFPLAFKAAGPLGAHRGFTANLPEC